MQKENVTIKTTLTMNERILIPQELMEGYFSADDAGNIIYTPYYADIMLISVFFLHCVEGLDFEKEENEITENIYESVVKDHELMQLYDEFFGQDKDTIADCPYKDTVVQMYGILSDVDKMAEFRKQQMIYQKNDALTELLLTAARKIDAVDPDKVNLKDAVDYLKTLQYPRITERREDSLE